MHIQHVQSKREIRTMLAAADVHPRKRWGQHFLIDGNLMRRLAASAELDPLDCVLEVGAGTGGLTDLIAGRVQQLICVELDPRLCRILEDRFRNEVDSGSLELVPGDILKSKHRVMPEVMSALERAGRSRSPVKLLANLPYQVATPLLMNLLVEFPQVRRLCFTVQREVGERIAAGANSKTYGPLSITAQCLCSIETIARIPREAFWPRPSVDSVMMRLEVNRSPFPDDDELRRFVALIRSTFEHRRKTLRSALAYAVSDTALTRVCHHVDMTRRPESLGIDEWLTIHRLVAAG